MTGGEPFVHPGFVELCDRLARRHVLSINTNLSGNVLARTVRLREQPTPCDTTYCPYVCEKRTRPPFVRPG